MAVGQVPGGRGEERQALLEPLRDADRGEQPHLRGGELDRERQPLESSADVGDRGRVLGRELEVGLHGLRPVDEEGAGGGAAHPLDAGVGDGVRHAERLHLEDALPSDPQHRAARDEQRHRRRDVEQPHEQRCRLHDLLEVVENEQHAPARERSRDALLERRLAGVADAEHVCDRRQQQSRLEHPLERKEVPSVREQIRGLPRDLDREPALADAARADQAHELRAALEERPHIGDLVVAADRARRGHGNARLGGRRDLLRPALALQPRLVEALGEQRREVV
nr:hypothetical protein [Microbacterium sp. JZ31]